jgi:hypothetical protein
MTNPSCSSSLPQDVQQAMKYARDRHWYLCDSRYAAVNGESQRCDCGLDVLLNLLSRESSRRIELEQELQALKDERRCANGHS